MTKIDIDVRKRLVSNLCNQPKYRRELTKLLYDLQRPSPSQPDGMPKGKGTTSDPTYNTVAYMHSNVWVEFLTRVCSTIEQCLFCLDRDVKF